MNSSVYGCIERLGTERGEEPESVILADVRLRTGCVVGGVVGARRVHRSVVNRKSLCARVRDDAIACTSADVERLSGRRTSICKHLGCGSQAGVAWTTLYLHVAMCVIVTGVMMCVCVCVPKQSKPKQSKISVVPSVGRSLAL